MLFHLSSRRWTTIPLPARVLQSHVTKRIKTPTSYWPTSPYFILSIPPLQCRGSTEVWMLSRVTFSRYTSLHLKMELRSLSARQHGMMKSWNHYFSFHCYVHIKFEYLVFLEELLKNSIPIYLFSVPSFYYNIILVSSKYVSTVKSCVESEMKTRYRKCVIFLHKFQTFLF